MKKIWRIRKRLIAGCLVVVLVLSMIFVPTKKAYAIVGFDDAAFILAMMAAAGIGFVGYNAYNGSNLAEDLWDELGSLEDDISDAYDKAVFTVLQGGGGGSDPNDFDPDNDDPEKKPTTWAKLKEWWKKHPNKALSMAATGSTIGYIMNVFGDNLNEKALQGQVVSDVLEIPQEVLSTMMSQIQAYPYFIIFYSGSDLERIVMASDYLYVSILRPTGASFVGSYCISNWYRIDKTLVPIGTLSSGMNYNFYTNVPVYSSEAEAMKNFSKDNIIYPSQFNPDSVQKTDARKQLEEKTNEEEKKKPIYNDVIMPSSDQMTAYVNKLDAISKSDADAATKNAQQQEALNQFVQSITNTSTNPDPKPDPSPEPDPSPKPDPDAPATDKEAAKYTADLTTVFPFCIPFDLIRAFKVLSAEGEAPVYKMPLKIDYKSIHVSEAWQIDMSDFASVIQILRVMETLGFIVGLILVTRKLIRG